MAMPGHMGGHGAPRLPPACYRGYRRCHLILRTAGRRAWFVEPDVVANALLSIRQHTLRCGFAIAAYCFMPDHLHLLLEGLRDEADLQVCVKGFKQQAGYQFRRRTGQCLRQSSHYDHVLRGEEDLLATARYVIANPVRAGLVKNLSQYPFIGSDLWSLHELCEAFQDLPER